MQLNLFDQNISIEEIFEAYYSCRKNKRSTINAVDFEIDHEQYLYQLWGDINLGRYFPGRSIAFIVNKPVKREIFAADFRDRVVHHLIINKLNPFFEKVFIYDSYACRIGKGTHFGIKRADRFVRKCSKNYKKDCYVLKLDIAGFFMHINRKVLFNNLKIFIEENYFEANRAILLDLCSKVIFYEPTKNCIIKGDPRGWNDLPKNKSLFYSPKDCGIPIGNLTSQVFANFYLNPLDHYIKKTLGFRYYGRYVDDLILIHENKEVLKSAISKISHFLENNLDLTLHPKKIYLQHYCKGFKYLGVFLNQNRIYVAKRTKGNFYNAIQKQNKILEKKSLTEGDLNKFLSSMNSYLGIMKHYKTFGFRRKIIERDLNEFWSNYILLDVNAEKFLNKRKFTGVAFL
jgi:RNA-directed DNA polymerase